MKSKLEMSMKILAVIKKCLNCSAKSKYYDKSKKLIIGKIKFETVGVAVEESFGLKSRCIRFS